MSPHDDSLQKIPTELTRCSRWVNYKLTPKKKAAGFDKVPVNRNGFEISALDPQNWISFDEAAAINPQRLGLAVGHPYIGVDLDHCFINRHFTQQFQVIYDQLPRTYAELSPSGKGLHLWYRCPHANKLPNQATGIFEVYTRQRFLTVTGDRLLSSPHDVTELELEDAERIFRMANPQAVAPNVHDGEPGCWDEDALLALLTAWKENIPGFDFQRGHKGFRIPCPGNCDGWAPGDAHSEKDPKLSRNAEVFIRNGWPCFWCFHQHCVSKTWKDLCDHYDPLRLFFEFDAWLEGELRSRGILQGGRP